MGAGGGQGDGSFGGRRRFGGRKRARAPDDPESVPAARGRAIGLLARRDLPRRALTGRLTDAGFHAEAAEAAVSELEDERLVNDERYVESAVASRAARGQGPVRIRAELLRMGVATELLEGAIDSRSPEWTERAVQVRSRRFGPERPASGAEAARQARFLQYRGFTHAQVRAALSGSPVNLEDLGSDDEEPIDDGEGPMDGA